jgi:hypothetical protein
MKKITHSDLLKIGKCHLQERGKTAIYWRLLILLYQKAMYTVTKISAKSKHIK